LVPCADLERLGNILAVDIVEREEAVLRVIEAKAKSWGDDGSPGTLVLQRQVWFDLKKGNDIFLRAALRVRKDSNMAYPRGLEVVVNGFSVSKGKTEAYEDERD
jgi:hypothetical protein